MVHPDIQAVRDAWQQIADKCKNGEARTPECIRACYNAFDLTNDLEAYFMLFEMLQQAPWITFLWPLFTFNSWIILILLLTVDGPVIPTLDEIGEGKRDSFGDWLYDLFIFQTWGFFEPISYLITQLAT